MVESREGVETFFRPCRRTKKIFAKEPKAINRKWSKCFNAIIKRCLIIRPCFASGYNLALEHFVHQVARLRTIAPRFVSIQSQLSKVN